MGITSLSPCGGLWVLNPHRTLRRLIRRCPVRSEVKVRNETLVWYSVRPGEGMKFRERVRVRDASSTEEYWSIKHTVLYRGLPSILPITITLRIQRHDPRPQGHQCDKTHRGQGSDTSVVCTSSHARRLTGHLIYCSRWPCR